MASRFINQLTGEVDEIRLYTGPVFTQEEVNGLYKQVTNGTPAIYNSSPTYRGKYLDNFPSFTSFVNGDWFLIYGLDDDPNARGVYLYKNGIASRLTGDLDNEAGYFVQALPDIIWATNNGYGIPANYGEITYIANLASNSIFTSALKVGADNLDTTIIQDGKIKTVLLDVDTILGNEAVFRGTLEASTGLFSGSIESGPLYLSVSPVASSSFATTSKKMRVFINDLIDGGIANGTYNCSGTYNSVDVAKITFSRVDSSSTTTAFSRATVADYYNNRWYVLERNWRRTIYTYVYNLTIYDASDNVLYTGSGTYKPSASWVITSQSEYYSYVEKTVISPPSDFAGSDTTPQTNLATGSISFTAGSYTMRLINLPAYSASLPTNTVYKESDGSGNYIVKIKG